MIIVGDLHLKETKVYFEAQKKFLNWLIKNYKNEVFVFLGDVFDSSSPQWEVYTFFKKFLLKTKNEIYILDGNHDISKRKGRSLSAFETLDRVHTISDIAELVIENKKCLLLPYKLSDFKEEYEALTGTYDYVFSHVHHPDVGYGEGVKLNVVATYYIYGHTHVHSIHYKRHIVLGVPLPTRNLEDVGFVLDLKDTGYSLINVPEFLKICTIKYGDPAVNKDWLYNIIDAPSYDSVYDTYKGYYIRDGGITLLRTENDFETNQGITFEKAKQSEKFLVFAKDSNIPKEETETILLYFEKAGIE